MDLDFCSADCICCTYFHLCCKQKRECGGISYIRIVGVLSYNLARICSEIIKVSQNRNHEHRAVKKIAGTKIGGRYLSDMAFRGSIGIYQGMAVNFLYLLFRVIAGIRYASVWFISIAVYYLVLGTLRAYLIFSYRRRKKYGLSYEYRCYRRTAWLLFY